MKSPSRQPRPGILPRGLLPLFMAVACCATASGPAAAARPQVHDAIAFEPPPGWKQETSADHVQFSRIDGGSWAQIAVYRSAPGRGDVEADFAEEWRTLVADAFGLHRPAQTSTPGNADGWSVMSGAGTWQHEGATVATLLTTYSGHGLRMSILCNATAQPYLQDCRRLVASAAPIPPAAPSPSATAAGARGDVPAAGADLDGQYRCLTLGFIRDLYTGVVSPHWEDKARVPRFSLAGGRYSAPQGSGEVSRLGDVLAFDGGPLDGFQTSIDRNDAGPFVVFRVDNPRAARPGSVGYDDTHCQRDARH